MYINLKLMTEHQVVHEKYSQQGIHLNIALNLIKRAAVTKYVASHLE